MLVTTTPAPVRWTCPFRPRAVRTLLLPLRRPPPSWSANAPTRCPSSCHQVFCPPPPRLLPHRAPPRQAVPHPPVPRALRPRRLVLRVTRCVCVLGPPPAVCVACAACARKPLCDTKAPPHCLVVAPPARSSSRNRSRWFCSVPWCDCSAPRPAPTTDPTPLIPAQRQAPRRVRRVPQVRRARRAQRARAPVVAVCVAFAWRCGRASPACWRSLRFASCCADRLSW
mmetsp:Transcript_10453/g.32167  ORF Transcript_10453/g.32167 Transcript_10453/m.32167 type:complete len:226 (-) Transcript_10453:377-1054(-)